MPLYSLITLHFTYFSTQSPSLFRHLSRQEIHFSKPCRQKVGSWPCSHVCTSCLTSACDLNHLARRCFVCREEMKVWRCQIRAVAQVLKNFPAQITDHTSSCVHTRSTVPLCPHMQYSTLVSTNAVQYPSVHTCSTVPPCPHMQYSTLVSTHAVQYPYVHTRSTVPLCPHTQYSTHCSIESSTKIAELELRKCFHLATNVRALSE